MDEMRLLRVAEALNLARIDEIKDYVACREWGVALDLLCNQIEEHQLPITAEIFAQLINIGVAMGMNAADFNDLKPYIRG